MSSSAVTPALEELEWLRALAMGLATGRATAGDADDLVQDTLLVATRHSPERSESGSLRPWLATVMRNRARMQARSRIRREQREREAHEVTLAAESPTSDTDLDRVRVLQAVLEALDELSELDRKIIMRRFFDGENATQIGQQLGISASTVRSRLRRSLAQLRASVDARFGDRRQSWALVLLGPTAALETVTGGSMMSIATKVTLAITAAGLAIGGGWWLSQDDEPHTIAATHESPEVESAPVDPMRQQWMARRDQIRSALSDSPEPAPDPELEHELRAKARSEFSALTRACMADLGSDASGAITLSAVLIGDPEVGMIYESIEVVTETVGDPEVLACLTESMLAYLGDKPATAFEQRFVTTMPWIGRDEDDTRKEKRVFEGIVGAHHSEVAFCERGADLEGTAFLDLEVTIGEDKLAEHVRVLATDLPTPVVDCIVTASRRWMFHATLVDKMFVYHFRLPVPGF